MFHFLYNIIVAPIELLVEIVFNFAARFLDDRYGFCLIVVSLVISLLTLPLYARADAVQKKQRDITQKMDFWIKHIKSSFKGDERFMMLNAYYKENNYSPIYVLKGSISLLLQIPFFTAAYHDLSNLESLKGISFLFIKNLGIPDAFFYIGSFPVNILPIMMTLFNFISATIYLKGFHLRDKIQTYGLAIIFLILLYNSPSGLVLYWTCNNLFSLCKNVIYKCKNPRKVVNFLSVSLGILFMFFSIFINHITSTKKLIFSLLIFTLCFLPLLSSTIQKKYKKTKKAGETEKTIDKNSNRLFICVALFFTVLTGLLIPSSVIVSSPIEFIDLADIHNPLQFLANSSAYALGFFLFWSMIIYLMVPSSFKKSFSFVYFISSVIAIVNYMFFGKKLGKISALLVYDLPLYFENTQIVINLLVSFVIVLTLFLFTKFIKKHSLIYLFTSLVLLIGVSSLSLVNIVKTNSSYKSFKNSYSDNSQQLISDITSVSPILNFSKTEKNVVVIMLDRAINAFFPYILNEKPELRNSFEGFTYFPNTISFAGHTNFGVPPLFGGYEYTPVEMNKRNEELLKDKHNEAISVLPVLFNDNSMNVTVCDIPYANYQHVSDLSIYNKWPDIKTYKTEGKYTKFFVYNNDLDAKIQTLNSNKRNFFCFSITKVLPLIIQPLFYQEGNYCSESDIDSVTQKMLDSFSVLDYLPKLSNSDSNKGLFLMMNNNLTHDPLILSLPDYTPYKTTYPVRLPSVPTTR